jgi:endo-1,4-beta-xylanase
VEPGDEITFTATVTGTNGPALTVTWSVSRADGEAVKTGTAFVPVTNITGVPNTATADVDRFLSGTVIPANATNQTFAWTVKSAGSTGASIVSGNILQTTSAGAATITATIAGSSGATSNYTQDFAITVTTIAPPFVPVTNITGVPSAATKGTDLALSGTVAPGNATNQTITWSVYSAGTTGASIVNGNRLRTTGAGTATVKATVTNGLTASSNYTKNFAVTVTLPFVAVSNISDVPGAATVGTDKTLGGTVTPVDATNQTITWSVYSAGTTGASVVSGKLRATAAGTATVRATVTNGLTASTNYTQNFDITVTPPVPATPTGVSATAASSSGITVGWTAVSGASGYKVYRSGTSGGTYSLLGSPATNAYPNTGLPANTTYFYKVSAVNAGGESPLSGAVSAKTMAVGNMNITVGFNYGEITITGSDGSNVISKSGAYGPTSLSLSATGYTSVIWYVDGATAGISGSPVTLNAANYSAQRHSIIFTGTANGHRSSSQPIPFAVLP